MMHRVPAMLAVVALAIAAVGLQPAAASGPTFDPPKQYYLALGDSLAFGYQQVKYDQQLATTGTVSPTAFTTGYVDDLSRLLRLIRPDLQTVNFGCPGATTVTFISSPGCPTYRFPLHNSYAASQLAAALAFLRAHPGQVSPITLDIGVNDFMSLLRECGGYATGALQCISTHLPGLLDQVTANVNLILAALRAADPSAEIIVMQYYNPIAVVPSLAALTNAAAEELNSIIAAAAEAHGARVADAFTPFNLAPQEPLTLCFLTLICTQQHDIHASDAGYLVIAQQFWVASDYARLVG